MIATAAHDTDAAELVALKGTYYAATRASGSAARADVLTGAHLDLVIEAGKAVDAACEAFRRRHYPRAHRVITAGGQVFTVSRTGSSIRLVWPGND